MPATSRVAPALTKSSRRSAWAAWTVTERSISAGSRPSLAHHSSRTRSLRRTRSGAPKPCQMSACSAVSRSVTFWPRPPIRIGSAPTGAGLSRASRALMRGSAAPSVAQAVRRGAELVAVLVVVALEPAGADAEDEAARREMWSTVRAMSASRSGLRYELQRDERADLRLRRSTRPSPPSSVQHSKCGPSGVAVQREEVVPVEQRVDARPPRRAARRRASRRSRCAAAGTARRRGSGHGHRRSS